MFELSSEQIDRFHQDGFVFIQGLVDDQRLDAAAARFGKLFQGEFETGVSPDEVNWLEGRDDPSLSRQICNGWKADRAVASVVLDGSLGRACATLAGWAGARLLQDNVVWKPPGARALAYHQDNAYLQWFAPGELLTCWIALDETTAEGGTMELARGSHRWGEFEMAQQFHAPEAYREEMLQAAAELGVEPDIVPVGGAAVRRLLPSWLDLSRLGPQQRSRTASLAGDALLFIRG